LTLFDASLFRSAIQDLSLSTLCSYLFGYYEELAMLLLDWCYAKLLELYLFNDPAYPFEGTLLLRG
jgi:hypothetical protein